MKAKTAIAVVFAFVFLLSCGCSTETVESPSFVDKSKTLRLGYFPCYDSAEALQNPDDPNSLMGIAQADGSVLIPPQYHSVLPAAKNRFVAEKTQDGNIVTGLVNEKNEAVLSFREGEIIPVAASADNSDCKTLIVNEPDSGAFLVNIDGHRLSDTTYDSITFLNENRLLAVRGSVADVLDYAGGLQRTYTDKEEQEDSFYHGALVRTAAFRGGWMKYGMTDRSGKTLIACEYDEIFPLSENRIVSRRGAPQGAMPDDTLQIVDATGQVICPVGEWHMVSFRKDGDICAQTGIGTRCGADNESGVSCWVIDQDGKKLSEEFDSISALEEGTFSAVKGGETVLLDAKGKPVNG